MWAAFNLRPCNGRTGVKLRLRALRMLMEHGQWTTEPLDVCVVSPHYRGVA